MNTNLGNLLLAIVSFLVLWQIFEYYNKRVVLVETGNENFTPGENPKHHLPFIMQDQGRYNVKNGQCPQHLKK